MPTRTTCSLCLVDLSDLRVIYERPVIIEAVGPNEVIDMPIKVNEDPITRAGAYAWELYLENERLAVSRMTATFQN